MRPEFSPAMLRLFLHARAADCGSQATLSRRLCRRARIAQDQFERAWIGRLNRAAPRAALWSALGLVPGDHGVRLTDDGGQEAVS